LQVRRAPILLQAIRANILAVYWQSLFARNGGLLSYRIDQEVNLRRAASYVRSHSARREAGGFAGSAADTLKI
jgi:hypothetical protein